MGKVYSSLPCFYDKTFNKIESKNEVKAQEEEGKNLSSTKLALNSDDNQPGKSGIREPKKKRSFKYSKENFVYLKRTDILKEYEFYERVGQGIIFHCNLHKGSFGLVYKAKDRQTKEIRAVKAINIIELSEKELENEINILKLVDHPNIIKLHEVFIDNSFVYLIEDYCKGGDLFDYIKLQRYFTEKKAASIMNQLLSALNHLHCNKIVHRDIKPDNIVFIETKSNEIFIKLIDFGTSIQKTKEALTQELGTVILKVKSNNRFIILLQRYFKIITMKNVMFGQLGLFFI